MAPLSKQIVPDKQENVTHTPKEKQVIRNRAKMTEMLKLAYKDFKT